MIEILKFLKFFISIAEKENVLEGVKTGVTFLLVLRKIMVLLHQAMNAVKIKRGIKKGEGRDPETMREENVREGKTVFLLLFFIYLSNSYFFPVEIGKDLEETMAMLKLLWEVLRVRVKLLLAMNGEKKKIESKIRAKIVGNAAIVIRTSEIILIFSKRRQNSMSNFL
jgi:hypothetical protein